MKKISQEELEEMLEKHKKWLDDKPDGERADLRDANLRGANLISIHAPVKGATAFLSHLFTII